MLNKKTFLIFVPICTYIYIYVYIFLWSNVNAEIIYMSFGLEIYLVLVNNQKHKNDISANTHMAYLNSQLSQSVEERDSSICWLIITYYKTNVPHTQLIISPILKHKIDKYVRYMLCYLQKTSYISSEINLCVESSPASWHDVMSPSQI